MVAAPAQATNLSFLGVALDRYRAHILSSLSQGATSISVDSTTGWPSSGNITIYDPTAGGLNTETVTYSAASGGVITCAATANAHGAGNLVVVTAAADAPTAYIPVRKFEPVDNLTILDDTGYRGSEVTNYGAVAGVIHGEYSTEGDVFAESFGYWLGCMLGDYTSSGSSAPYTHNFAILNAANANGYGGGQPNSMTVVDYSGLTSGGKARAYPGCVVSELTVQFNAEGLLTYSTKLTGYSSGAVPKPTSSWTSTTVPTPVWVGTTSIASSPVLYVESGEIAMKRDVKVLHTVDGTQSPYGVWLGPLETTGKMTFLAADETELLRYLNNTQPSTVWNWTTGTGASLSQVQASCAKVAYKATKVMRGQTYTTVETDLSMIGNTSNVGASGGYGPVAWQLKNAVTGSTYQ